MEKEKSISDLLAEIDELRVQLDEANLTIEAIRNGEVDALVVEGRNGHELYTLHSADRTYRTFIEKMSEGAVTLDAQSLIVFCNKSFSNLVALSTGELIANPLSDYVLHDDLDKLTHLLEEGWRNDVKGEIRLRAENRTVPVQLSVTSLKIDDRIALSIIVTDLTSQKQVMHTLKLHGEQLQSINEELEKSNHDLQQFASVASHDLQEPLRKIQVFSHLMKEKFAHEFSETSSGYLNKIVHAANRMKVLIVDILNYSRLSARDNYYVKTDIRALINELLLDLELVIKEKNAVIEVSDLPEIQINPGQMRQVFQNLLSNALKFSKKNESPLIEIFSGQAPSEFQHELSRPIDYVHLHIKDNGIGFEEKFSSAIFNLFEKLHSKDDYDGTGIGLAITKKIIEKHRGQINVVSTVNVGTEFILSLPVNSR